MSPIEKKIMQLQARLCGPRKHRVAEEEMSYDDDPVAGALLDISLILLEAAGDGFNVLQGLSESGFLTADPETVRGLEFLTVKLEGLIEDSGLDDESDEDEGDSFASDKTAQRIRSLERRLGKMKLPNSRLRRKGTSAPQMPVTPEQKANLHNPLRLTSDAVADPDEAPKENDTDAIYSRYL